jgi:hypothetical protein
MAQATTDLSRRTPQHVFAHHGEALKAEDLDAMLQDYAETACIITPDAVTCGKEDVRTFFARLVQMLPHAQWNVKTTFADNILLLEWTADSARGSVADGVDTVVFRDGLIHSQTVRFTLVPKP